MKENLSQINQFCNKEKSKRLNNVILFTYCTVSVRTNKVHVPAVVLPMVAVPPGLGHSGDLLVGDRGRHQWAVAGLSDQLGICRPTSVPYDGFCNFNLRQVHHQHTSWFVYIIETWRRFSIKDIRMIQYMYNRHTDDQKLHIYRQSNITDILTIQYYRHTKNPKLQTYRRSNLTDIQTVQYNKHIYKYNIIDIQTFN